MILCRIGSAGIDGTARHQDRHRRRQPDKLLQQPGKGPDDGVIGGHADVVVAGERAWLFYFTHPGRGNAHGGAGTGTDGPDQRRSALQVTALIQSGDRLRVERDAPTRMAPGGG